MLWRLAAASGAAAILASTFWAQSSDKPGGPQPPRKIVNTPSQLPAGALQQKAASACLECHEASIILQQRLSKPAWTREVDKMVRWGALVDANDRDALIDYLSTNFSPDQPAYDAPRTSREKATIKNADRNSGH